MGRRLFIAMFGGLDPRVWKVGDRDGFRYDYMDSAIGDAYHIAVEAMGGYSQHVPNHEYQVTREEYIRRMRFAEPDYVERGYLDDEIALAEERPDELISRVGTLRAAYPPVSNNSFIFPAHDLDTAIGYVETIARPGDVIGELLLLDHGLMAGDQFTSMSFGKDMISAFSTGPDGGHHIDEFARLRPFVDEQTIISLAGCSVASNAEGRQLLINVATILGVRAQGFTEDQFVHYPGIEGTVVICDPSGCLENPGSETTPFAQTVYGHPVEYGNDDPGWE